MARPRKNSSNDLIRLIDEYFSTEAAGDPSKLKSSLLAKYASEHGVAAKDYDFRRDPDVRAHISYLKKLVSGENDASIVKGSAYKTLDVRAILSKYTDKDSLISVLSEMDSYWKNIYDAAQLANDEISECRKNISVIQKELDNLRESDAEHTVSIRSLKSENYHLTVENRYLRSMLRTYLYPSLANRLLQEEHVIQGGTESLSADAGSKLIDGAFPSSVSEAVKEDRSMQSREKQLLDQMWDSVGGPHEN